jgi:aminoglycoside phosphotransferase (APT) family kinase protein
LGKLRDLEQWLQLPQELDRVRDVGASLGNFVGRLHSADPSLLASHNLSFSKRIGHDLVKTAIVDTLLGYLNLFGIPGAERLHEIVARTHSDIDVTPRKEQPGLVFSIGDFWPPSILVDDDKDRVNIVDWEFAGFAPPMQDMAQLGE